jgi:hypothetical protein
VVGGLLTTYASWRWTLIVNAPIGIVLALAAPLVLKEPARQSGRFDLLGAVTSAGGIAALVYGLSAAAPSGAFDVSHWASARPTLDLLPGEVPGRVGRKQPFRTGFRARAPGRDCRGLDASASQERVEGR